MDKLYILFYASMAFWFLSELFYKRMMKSSDKDQKSDKSTLNMLWLVIMFSIAGAITIWNLFNFPIIRNIWILYIGEAFILLGIISRIFIIKSLGKYFTVDVAIRKDHKIKKDGIYKYLRHPSYSASLLTFLGFGLFLNNWVSLIVAIIPTFLAFRYRIKIEEKALSDQFGEDYIQYKKSTKKLIPFIY